MHAKSMMTPAALQDTTAQLPWLLGGHMHQNTRRTADSHAHERGQIFGITSGVIGVRTAGAYWHIGPGQCLWLPPQILHNARSHGAIAGWSLYVREDYCAHLPTDPFLARGTRLFIAQAERLSHCADPKDWDNRTERLAHSFWDEFLELPRASFSLPYPSTERLRRVVEKLSENPADHRDQQEWAHYASMSLRSFVRHFSAETGLSFSAWRQRLRILHAQEQLARGEAVTAVALEVGYESPAAFAAAFRSATGRSPRDYSKFIMSGG